MGDGKAVKIGRAYWGEEISKIDDLGDSRHPPLRAYVVDWVSQLLEDWRSKVESSGRES